MASGGPRLYRFYNYEQVQYLPAPSAGWNPDVSPSELPDTQAAILDNFLIRPGKIIPRGAFSVWADLSADLPLNVCGLHPHLGDPSIIVSRKVASATAYIDPWNAPLIRPSLVGQLAAPNTTVLFANGGTSITPVTTTAAKVPGPRGITYDGTRYYIGYGTSSSPVLDVGGSYVAQSTSLCTQSSLTFTELTNAPHGALDLKGYLSRIWLLGGIDTPGSGTTFDPLTLFFTRPIGPGGGTATADWQDPVSGLTNQIVMDGDTYDPGVGLATTRNALMIFRPQSVLALRGTTSASFVLVPISREVGCVDPRSIVECDRGVYFLSHKGLMLTDGNSVLNVSGSVTQTIQNAVAIYLANVLSSFGGYATCARISDGQILVSIGVASTTSSVPNGHIQPVWSGLYNPDTQAWTRVTSAIWALDGSITVPGNNYPGWAVGFPDGRVQTIGDQYITQLEAPASAGAAGYISRLYAGHAADDATVGTVAWLNPDRVTSDDGLSATAGPVSAAITHYIHTSQHGFTVPGNATINGIQVDVKRAYSGAFSVVDNAVKLIRAGTIQATDRGDHVTNWPTSPSYVSYGGATDLWGGAWTPADINANGFGVAVSANSANSAQLRVDAIRIAVYYSIPPSPTAGASFVQGPGLYDQMADGTFQPIPAFWRSHFAPLAIPNVRQGIAKRMVADYVFQGNGILAASGWTITPRDEQSSAYVPSVSVPVLVGSNSGSVSGGQPVPPTLIQHFNQDVLNEMRYLMFDVAWIDTVRGSAPSNVIAELYGVGIEFQRTRDLR